jgi:hypothetical protein
MFSISGVLFHARNSSISLSAQKGPENPLISVDSLIREKDAFTPAIYPLPPNASAG